jgi:hypothetical protein
MKGLAGGRLATCHAPDQRDLPGRGVEGGECAVQLVGASAANTSSCVDSVVWIASKRSK